MGNYDAVVNAVKAVGIVPGSNIEIKKYIDNMDVVMNAADVVICRSGAITLSELCTLGKTSILIPSPNVTNNHQEYNARALESIGAAVKISETDFNVQRLEKEINSASKITDENGKKKDKLDVKLIASLKSVRDMYSKDFFRCCNELSLSPQARAKISISATTPEKKKLMDILNEEDDD